MKKAGLRKRAEQRLLKEKLLAVIAGAFVVVMVGWLVLLVWQKGNQRVDTSDFDGKIVDRWAGYAESDTRGSQPYFRLNIEGDNGKRFTLRVDPGVYESARVGMRIKRRSGQLVLIDTSETSPGK